MDEFFYSKEKIRVSFAYTNYFALDGDETATDLKKC